MTRNRQSNSRRTVGTPGSSGTAHILPLLVVVAATLLLAACGGNSPTSPSPPQPPPQPPPPRVTFVADAANPGLDAISLRLGASAADSFTLTMRAEEVTDLYGFGVDVVFDPALVAFASFTAGTFLDETGIAVTTQVVEGPPGTLVIGQSRVGDVFGVSGSGTVVSLEFTTVAAGTSAIEVQNAAAFDSTGAATDISFFGGSVTVPVSAR